jgi:ADP-heptose:LPS heptosyltransferase
MLDLPKPLTAQIERHGAGLSVLVIRLGAMGDIVRTLPAVRLVRFALPDARIHWLAWEPWSALLARHPDLDGVVAVPRAAIRAQAKDPSRWAGLAGTTRRLALQIRALSASLVLDFHGDLRSALLGRLSGAAVRLGYEGHQQKEGNRLLTTHRVPSGDRRTPRLERNLDLVRALGLPVRPIPDAGIEIDDASLTEAKTIVASLGVGGEYAILSPGASLRQAYKKPPAPLFAAAARRLRRAMVTPIVVHGPGEEEDAVSVITASEGAAVLAPPTGLMTLAALLSAARLFVGGDSGPLHLACGLGCPVVGIYGPTDPVVNTPWNVPFETVSPVGKRYTGIKSIDRSAAGFEGIADGMVARAVEAVLSRPRSADQVLE